MNTTVKTKKIFMTGITGNLGAFAAQRFLKMGFCITALVRTKTSITQNAHIKKIKKSLSVFMEKNKIEAYLASGNLKAIKAQMTDAEGMRAINLDEEFDETWHFASSLKYMPKDREEIYAANIGGVKNILAFHERHAHKASKFIYISTAYVGGKTIMHLPEKQVPLTEDFTFKNEYEKSKLMAENIVLDHTRKNKMFSTVFRPSIVMGDTRTKRLINYTGFYLALDSLVNLNEYVKNSNKSAETLRFASDNTLGLNLIPIDHVIDNMIAINTTIKIAHQVFNLTNKSNLSLDDLQGNLQFSHIKVSVVPPADFNKKGRTRSEKLMAYGFNYILPYANNDVKFDTEKSSIALGKEYDYVYHPAIIGEIVDEYVERKNKVEALLQPLG